MSNKRWYILLLLFASPLLIVVFLAYYISFVAFADTDNTNQLTSNLSQIHSAITGQSSFDADEINEFSPENITDEALINSSTDISSQQTTEERLIIEGFEIMYNEDINLVEGNEIVAVKPVDLDISDTYPDMTVVSELRVYSNGPAIIGGWPLLIFDKINLPTSILELDQPPKNNLFAIQTEWDPNNRIKFTLCPIDHLGEFTAQCGGYIWDGPVDKYDFYGGGKNPDWETLK